MASEMVVRAARALNVAMMKHPAFREQGPLGADLTPLALAVIEEIREMPSEPGPRYTAGEYSRRTQAAMVDDALAAPYESDLMPVYGSRPSDD